MNHLLQCHEILRTDFVRADDCFVFDDAGRRYVDFESGIWCMALGHGHPRISSAALAQIGKVVHLGTRYPSPLAEAAAIALLERLGLPGGKCVFLSSGSEAVELAVRAARRVTGRRFLLAPSGCYLGAYDSLGRAGEAGWITVDWRSCAACSRGDLSCAHLAAIPFDEVAALVLEPGSASGRVEFPPTPFVTALASEVRRRGGLLVANEVTTGLGRTGEWFGYDHYALQPDLTALGKALGNGFPVSAVAMRGEIARMLERGGFRYAQSHQNDPFGCAIALEVLATLEEEGLVERSRRLGALFLQRLREIGGRAGGVVEARGRGLMIALQLGEEVAAGQLHGDLLRGGFLTGLDREANVLRFYPPLVIGVAEIYDLLALLERLLAAGRWLSARECALFEERPSPAA
jgi:acetylornithine/N-succinyldiaminopimelate aminotransferase